MRKWFFPAMGFVFLAVAIAGFGPGFVFPLLQGEFDFPLRVHAHAAIMFGWLILFIVQATLATRGRYRLHARLGVSSLLLFGALMYSIVTVSVRGLLAPLPPDVEVLIDNIFFLQLCAFVLAPLLFALALSARKRRPEHHKRYMYFLTFFLIEAAASRMTFLPGMQQNETFLLAQYFYLDLLLLPLIVFDFKTMGRLSPATAIGLGVFAVYQGTALAVWYSPWWRDAVNIIETWLQRVFAGG